jgi:hypothetical protein
MLPAITYAMPSHKTYPPKFPAIVEAETEILKCLSDPRGRLALSYHEASHAIQFRRFGLETAFSGPTVFHDCATDSFSACYGAVQVRDADYLKLAQEPEKFAKVLVAGRVAELVLMGKTDEGSSDGDFSDFLLFSKGKPHELILIWKRAEEEYLRELSADLNQQREIVHLAALFEEEIFGTDRSVREAPSQPAEMTAG